MDDQLFFQELTDAAEAIGRISDEERFRGLFDAFRAGDLIALGKHFVREAVGRANSGRAGSL